MYRINNIRPSLPCLLCIRTKFTLDPNDLVIQNVIGSGPGGQKVARTRNKVIVKHVPTNIVVNCHQTRFLDQNKRIAIQKLTEKVELHLYGSESSVAIKKEKKLEGYAETKLSIKEESDKRIAANKLKREAAQAARREDLNKISNSGLPFLRSSNDSSGSEEEEEEEDKSDPVSSEKDISSLDTQIFRDKSHEQTQHSLKSMFGVPSKKK